MSKEYDFTVSYACGHSLWLAGPDEAYEARQRESVHDQTCEACIALDEAIDQLQEGSVQGACDRLRTVLEWPGRMEEWRGPLLAGVTAIRDASR